MDAPASRLRLLTCALIVKLSLIFRFIHCSSLQTASASFQMMLDPVSATYNCYRPLLLSAFLSIHLYSVIRCCNTIPVSTYMHIHPTTLTCDPVYNSFDVAGTCRSFDLRHVVSQSEICLEDCSDVEIPYNSLHIFT